MQETIAPITSEDNVGAGAHVIETPTKLKPESIAIFREEKEDQAKRFLAAIEEENSTSLNRAERQADPNWGSAAPDVYVVADTPATLHMGGIVYTKAQHTYNVSEYISQDAPQLPIISVALDRARGQNGEPMKTVRRLIVTYNSGVVGGQSKYERVFEAQDKHVLAETRTVKEADGKNGIRATRWFFDYVPDEEKEAWMDEEKWNVSQVRPSGNELNVKFNNTKGVIEVLPSYQFDEGAYTYPSREAVLALLAEAAMVVPTTGRQYRLVLNEYANQSPPTTRPKLPTEISFE